MTLLVTAVLALVFFGLALGLIAKVLSRTASKVPSRLPREWVEDYRAEGD